jgi:hypothetical protein
MAELPTALATALAGDRPPLFGAIEIDFPGYELLLLDGAGQMPIGGRKFVGRDAIYGVVDTIKGLADLSNNQSPVVTLTLIPPASTSMTTLLDPAAQGSPVIISIGSYNISTGLPVSLPYVFFTGELDVPTPKWGTRDRRVEYRITSVAERLFQTEEGKRLSDSWHQSVWPGEMGLSLVTDVETYVPWGQKLDLTAVETRTDMPAIGQITTKRT